MNLLTEIEKLPAAAQAEIHDIASLAGVEIKKVEGVISSPLAYLKAHCWAIAGFFLAGACAGTLVIALL